MKTEKEIRYKKERLQERINLSFDASELGEDIIGKDTELSEQILLIFVTKRQTLEWVLEEEVGK